MPSRAPCDPIPPDLVLVPAGRFRMGRDDRRPDERPAHTVPLPAFRAARLPVTNAEYARFLAATAAPAPRFWDDAQFNAPGQPVVGVSWFDAVAYCAWLCATTGLPCRLPNEAEREYAALGGREGVDWPWGDADPLADPARAFVDAAPGPHVPRAACANGYGLRCMAENVHEWCSDWYTRDAYARAAAPTGETQRRASRGGSWRHAVKFTRVSARSSLSPAFRYNDYGFRVFADA